MRPLEGRRVLVTRAAEAAGPLARLLADAGAEAVEVAAIEIAEPADWGPLDAALGRLDDYAWVALTSANAVRGLFTRLRGRPLSGPRLAAVGEATAGEMESRGVPPDLVASDATGAGLGRALVEASARAGARVLVARAQEGRPELVRTLSEAGAAVDEVATHRTVPAPGAEARVREALARGLDAAIFMSPSAVRSAAAPLRGTAVVIACIGPTTAESAEEMGLSPSVVPSAHTAEALVEALCAHFARS